MITYRNSDFDFYSITWNCREVTLQITSLLYISKEAKWKDSLNLKQNFKSENKNK